MPLGRLCHCLLEKGRATQACGSPEKAEQGKLITPISLTSQCKCLPLSMTFVFQLIQTRNHFHQGRGGGKEGGPA